MPNLRHKRMDPLENNIMIFIPILKNDLISLGINTPTDDNGLRNEALPYLSMVRIGILDPIINPIYDRQVGDVLSANHKMRVEPNQLSKRTFFEDMFFRFSMTTTKWENIFNPEASPTEIISEGKTSMHSFPPEESDFIGNVNSPNIPPISCERILLVCDRDIHPANEICLFHVINHFNFVMIPESLMDLPLPILHFKLSVTMCLVLYNLFHRGEAAAGQAIIWIDFLPSQEPQKKLFIRELQALATLSVKRVKWRRFRFIHEESRGLVKDMQQKLHIRARLTIGFEEDKCPLERKEATIPVMSWARVSQCCCLGMPELVTTVFLCLASKVEEDLKSCKFNLKILNLVTNITKSSLIPQTRRDNVTKLRMLKPHHLKVKRLRSAPIFLCSLDNQRGMIRGSNGGTSYSSTIPAYNIHGDFGVFISSSGGASLFFFLGGLDMLISSSSLSAFLLAPSWEWVKFSILCSGKRSSSERLQFKLKIISVVGDILVRVPPVMAFVSPSCCSCAGVLVLLGPPISKCGVGVRIFPPCEPSPDQKNQDVKGLGAPLFEVEHGLHVSLSIHRNPRVKFKLDRISSFGSVIIPISVVDSPYECCSAMWMISKMTSFRDKRMMNWYSDSDSKESEVPRKSGSPINISDIPRQISYLPESINNTLKALNFEMTFVNEHGNKTFLPESSVCSNIFLIDTDDWCLSWSWRRGWPFKDIIRVSDFLHWSTNLRVTRISPANFARIMNHFDSSFLSNSVFWIW
ncbi:uncharacterized protein G2W53_021874 [Senna tora]|uniref:Uncharacterized protein n=1 Tax=Senna tora TaxID=362788 RepID=A0A834WHM6_9FABA|nr:uncharacterized protein G2W53_021874 [Senna tora]